jgi:hypothetical protein
MFGDETNIYTIEGFLLVTVSTELTLRNSREFWAAGPELDSVQLLRRAWTQKYNA